MVGVRAKQKVVNAREMKVAPFSLLKCVRVQYLIGPTKHRKELPVQGTENSAKNYKVLQDTFKRSTK